MDILTIVQARLGSSRLPGKTMKPIMGQPLLYRQVERIQAAQLAGKLVVATTTEPQDDAIESLCLGKKIPCYRGHPTDLLDRHYRAGLMFQAEVISKIPSDCPLIDPEVIDEVYGVFLQAPGAYDYVSNLHPATYPDGNDVEIITMPALETAWKEALYDFEREHTTPFIWERPQHFRLHNVEWKTGLNYSISHRWTIDYAEDYEFIKAVYEALYPQQPYFKLNDILELLTHRPDIAEINQKHLGKNWYAHHLHELKTVSQEHSMIIKNDRK